MQRIHKLIAFVAGIIHPGRDSPNNPSEESAADFRNSAYLGVLQREASESGCVPLVAEVEILSKRCPDVLENRLASQSTWENNGIQEGIRR